MDKVILKATVDQVDDISIEAIAKKRDIVLPSDHIAIFIASLAPLEKANQNGVRLSEEASRKFLTTINQAQVNFEHFGRGFICGAVIDSWIDEATQETKVAFTFHKFIYADEYTRALGLMALGELSVSFELLADTATKQNMDDGTVRLNDFTYTGMGLLLDNPPAYKDAQVFEFARKVRDKINQSEAKQLVYANKMLETCDEILADGLIQATEKGFLVTTFDNDHTHMAEIDMDGNGITVSGHGDGKHEQPHVIANWQIQLADNADPATGRHTHRILNEIIAKVKDLVNKESIKSLNEKGGNKFMNEEQAKEVADIRVELGDFAKDVSDEDLLNAEKVEELKKAKADAETEAKTEETTEEKAEEKADDDADKADDAEAEKESEAEEKEEEAEADDADAEAKKDDAEEEKEAEAEEAKEEDKDAKIAELENRVAELEATLEAKDSEIEAVRIDAEKVGKLKVELADNPHTKDFTAEDFLNEDKVKQARLLKENDDLKAENAKLSETKKEVVEASEEEIDTGSKKSNDKSFSSIIKSNYDRKRGKKA